MKLKVLFSFRFIYDIKSWKFFIAEKKHRNFLQLQVLSAAVAQTGQAQAEVAKELTSDFEIEKIKRTISWYWNWRTSTTC